MLVAIAPKSHGEIFRTENLCGDVWPEVNRGFAASRSPSNESVKCITSRSHKVMTGPNGPANNQKARKKSRKERVISYRTLPKQSGGGLERSAVSSAKSGVQNVGVLAGQTKTGRRKIIRDLGQSNGLSRLIVG